MTDDVKTAIEEFERIVDGHNGHPNLVTTSDVERARKALYDFITAQETAEMEELRRRLSEAVQKASDADFQKEEFRRRLEGACKRAEDWSRRALAAEPSVHYAEQLCETAREAWFGWIDGLDEDASFPPDHPMMRIRDLTTVECTVCEGVGRVNDGHCDECHGFGRVGITAVAALSKNTAERGTCDMPECKGLGVVGNENLIDGKRVCDYCHKSAVLGVRTEERKERDTAILLKAVDDVLALDDSTAEPNLRYALGRLLLAAEVAKGRYRTIPDSECLDCGNPKDKCPDDCPRVRAGGTRTLPSQENTEKT